MTDPKSIRDSFTQRTVLIVGDLVADQFLYGTISRVSREAPVFILRHETTATLPGAAANAAANVASLGGNPILVGVAGQDANGDKLIHTLENLGVRCDWVLRSNDFATTTKVRVLAGQHYAARQQVIRIDYENSAETADALRQALRDRVAANLGAADAIILSDYNYGAIFAEVISDVLAFSKQKSVPVVVDSRYRLESLAGATTATPNREEVEQILGEDFTEAACGRLRERLGLDALLVTNGNQGMSLYEKGRPNLKLDCVGSPEPVDVTGAGDTVIAAYALGLASGFSFSESAKIANHAGGLVVMKKGTACVTAEELTESLSADAENLPSAKAIA